MRLLRKMAEWSKVQSVAFIAPDSDLEKQTGFVAPSQDLEQTTTGSTAAELEPESGLMTAGREFASKIFPAIGTAAAGLAAGAAAAPTGPGAIAADIAGGIAGGAATEAAQRKVMGDTWSDQNIAQMEVNAKAHPHWAMFGGAGPFIVSAFGGGGGLAKGAATSAAKGLEGAAAKEAAQLAKAKAEKSFLSSATGFGRAGGAEAGEKNVEGQDTSILEGAGKGFLTGGAMHFIPGNAPKWLGGPEEGSKVFADVAKNALWRVTGKAVGDATAMVVANKAADSIIHGKPFTIGDIAGDSAAATVDFALLNAIHAGFELKRATKVAENDLGPLTTQALKKVEADLAAPKNVPKAAIDDEIKAPSEEEKAPVPPVASEPPVDTVEPNPPAPPSTEDPHIVSAAYTAPDGTVQEGVNHIEAAQKSGVVAPPEPENRESPEYGFKIQHADGTTEIVGRSKALEIAQKNGQLKTDAAPEREVLHSDQINMGEEAHWKDVPVERSNQSAFTSEKEARDAFASDDPDNGGVKDIAKPESFREYLMRMRCRGFTV